LPNEYFGEGITIFDDKIVQLTWQSKKGFLYDKHSFDLLQEFSYPTEGWGITYDGSRLIMSDGTATLYFLDTETFEKVGQVEVHDNGPVTELNELEYVQGEVYANIWKEEKIAVIDPQTGQVKGCIDMSGIKDPENQGTNNVLNGIAYDAKEDRLFVTGKRWSQLFEIKLIPLEWLLISSTFNNQNCEVIAMVKIPNGTDEEDSTAVRKLRTVRARFSIV
jgi:glutamine cyclotransferase